MFFLREVAQIGIFVHFSSKTSTDAEKVTLNIHNFQNKTERNVHMTAGTSYTNSFIPSLRMWNVGEQKQFSNVGCGEVRGVDRNLDLDLEVWTEIWTEKVFSMTCG